MKESLKNRVEKLERILSSLSKDNECYINRNCCILERCGYYKECLTNAIKIANNLRYFKGKEEFK